MNAGLSEYAVALGHEVAAVILRTQPLDQEVVIDQMVYSAIYLGRCQYEREQDQDEAYSIALLACMRNLVEFSGSEDH